MNAAWRDFNKYWGLTIKSWGPRKDGLINDALLFFIQCLIYFHLFLGHVFPFYKEREKLRPTEKPKIAWHCKLSPAFLTPCLTLGPTSLSYMLGKSVSLWLNSYPRAPRMAIRKHWFQNCQSNIFTYKTVWTDTVLTCASSPPTSPSLSPARSNH